MQGLAIVKVANEALIFSCFKGTLAMLFPYISLTTAEVLLNQFHIHNLVK